MENSEIQALIESHFPDGRIVFDGDGYQFQTTIISQKFEGLNTVKRHQMVYASLGDLISSGQLHALTINAYTEQEWTELHG